MKYNLVYAEFYKTYVSLAEADPISKAIDKNTDEMLKLLDRIPASKIDHAYAPGKWTIKELLQHIIDAERVFAYRILRIARMDTTPLPGFDENAWAANALVGDRRWKDMVKEFKWLRKSNMAMIDDLSKAQLDATGTASNNPVSAAALCYVLVGHVKHHMNIIEERYL